MPEPKRKAQLTLRCPGCGHTWKAYGNAYSGVADHEVDTICEKCNGYGEVVNCEEEED